jgi:hypothetical protein
LGFYSDPDSKLTSMANQLQNDTAATVNAAAFTSQSRPDKVDVDVWVSVHRRTGVVYGCAVTGSGIGTIAYAGGQVIVGGRRAIVSSGTLTPTAADVTNPRIDLVEVDNTGAVSLHAGTAAATPDIPQPSTDSDGLLTKAVLATLYVAANSTTWAANTLLDKRMFVGSSGASIYGSGSDGDLVLIANTNAAARDVFYRNLTLAGFTLTLTKGTIIHVSESCDGGGGIVTAHAPIAGATATTATGGASGASTYATGLGVNTVTAPGSATNGGTAVASGTSATSSVTAPITSLGVGGGRGGSGGAAGGGTPGVAGGSGVVGVITTSACLPRALASIILSRFVIPTGSASGGGGGAGDGTNAGGGGGGGGSGGWGLYAFVRKIVSSVTFSSVGGAGGNGAPGVGGNAGGGGGGGGGSGGPVILVYQIDAVGVTLSSTAGAGGSGGAAAGTGSVGVAGSAGGTSTTFPIQDI